MTVKLITASLTAHNTFSNPAELIGYFNISISGTWVGRVTAQRSFDSGSTYRDMRTWEKNAEEYGFEPERGVYYRVGVKTGHYTSGTVELRIAQ